MAVNILLKRSSTANKRPTTVQAPLGSVVLNFDAATGGLYYQDSAAGIVKVGPAQVSATAPNATPAGSNGNSLGEFWYDTTNSALKIWTGSAWVTAGGGGGSGTVTSVTGTSPIVVNNATPSTPVIGINPASTTTAGAVQLNDTIVSTSTTLAATANSVKLVADLANTMLPKAGGTMTGAIVFAAGQTFPVTGFQDATASQKGVVQIGTNIQVAAGVISVLASSTSQAGVVQLNDTTGSTSVTEAATANAVKTTFDIANVALPKAGGTMTGAIVFVAGQTFPISGIQDATGAQKGVVQIGANITVASGTISIANATSVIPGVVTVGTNIGVTAGVISVLSSSTTQAGVVQLVDSVASTSATQALTANQGLILQGQINSLVASSNLTLAGTISASSGNMVTVTADGTLKSFVVGSPLPSAAVGNTDYFAIVTTPGTFTPPGGSSTTFNAGDWVLSNGTIWERLSVGFAGSAATSTTSGLVELATNAETQTGTDANTAVTPASLQSKLSDSTSTTSSNTIASSTAVKSAFDLATAAVPKSTVTTAGDLIYGTGAAAVARLGIGTVGQVLTVNAGATAPVWSTIGSATPTVAGLVFGITSDPNLNVALGKSAGSNITTGCCNVALGPNAAVASATGNCQLALGFSATNNWLTGNSTKAIKPGAGIIDCANSCGTAGQFLKSNGANALCWGPVPAATTGTFDDVAITGIVYGCTTLDSTALGIAAARAAYSVGSSSACNLAIGVAAMANIGLGGCNTIVGNNSNGLATRGCLNTVVGYSSMSVALEGDCNVVLGTYAGTGMRCASNNVVIGHYITTPLSCGSCQLAIGYDFGCCWLTGTSTKAIKPGAGIIDCANSCGSAGQALMSNGANAVCWGSVIPASTVTSFNATSNCGFYGGNLLISQWEDGNILTPTALNPGPEGSMLCFNSTINGLAWCVPNFVRGNQFAKGSIAVGCAQVGGGISTATFNGTGNNPGVAVGYYESIPLTGGTGSGATANFTVFIGGPVTVIEFVSISDPGSGYLVGDDLTVVINSVTIPYTLNVDTLATNTLNNYSFLPVGTNGQVLAADSTCTNGVKWTTSAAGPATPTSAGGVIGCTDASNAAVGCNALLSRTTGTGNIAIGLCSLSSLTTGVNNVAIGNGAFRSNVNGSGSVFIGTSAGCSMNSTDRVVGIGENALQFATSSAYSTAVGWGALCTVTTGGCNTALGGAAGSFITTGTYNLAIGANVQVPFGNQNCQLAVGWENCRWITGDCGKNLCVYNSFVVKNGGGSGPTGLAVNDTYFFPDGNFGASLTFGNCFGDGKNYVQFRNQSNNVIGWIAQFNSSTVSYVTTSDYRLKKNVKDLEGATEVLRALPVREYNFISEPETVNQGFIAHELQEFVPQAVTGTKDEVDKEGNAKYQGVDASKVVPLLTAALKESIARIDALEAEVKELKSNA